MKFKPGDKLVYLCTMKPRRIVVRIEGDRYILKSVNVEESREINLSKAYVEDEYELQEILDSPLYKAMRED